MVLFLTPFRVFVENVPHTSKYTQHTQELNVILSKRIGSEALVWGYQPLLTP